MYPACGLSAAASAFAWARSGVSRATQMGLGTLIRRALSRDRSAAQIDQFCRCQVFDRCAAGLEKGDFFSGLAALHAATAKIEEIGFNPVHGEKPLGLGLDQVA